MSRPQYLDPAPFLPTKADGYERKMVYPFSSSAVLSRETARLRLENKSIEKRFDSLYEQAYAARVQLKNIEAAASRGTLDGSNFAAVELLKLSTRIMELLAQQPEEACMRFIPDVLACLALCHVRDRRLHAAGQRLRHALTCVSRASSQARRTVFQPIGRPAGVAPPDLKWLATVTDDMTWLRQAEQWDQYPMDLRWLAIASGDKSVLLHRYAWQHASMDLRFLTVLTGDLDWLHVGAERWRSTPAEIRLRAVAQRNPLLLCPAAIPLAARIEEEAYAELRSEITESLPALPFGLSPEEDLDISLQLHLASDRPSSMFWGHEGLQKEKMQRDAEGVSAPPSPTVTGDAARPSVVKNAVSPRVPPAAKLQLGVGVEKKADVVAVSPSAKIAGKLTQPAKPAVQKKKEEASHKGDAFPQVTGKPALSVEKKLPTVPVTKGATASPVEKKAGAALIASPPSSADAKTAGATGLPRTLKSPQAMVTKVPGELEAQDTLTVGVPPSALPKLAPAMLAKGGVETKQLELERKKVGISPPAAVVSEAGVETGVEQKIPGPPGGKVAAQSSTPPFISKTGFPLKKGAGIEAAEGPAAVTAGERKAPILDKVHEGTKAAGKTDGTPSAVTPAGERPGKKAGPPGPPKIGGPSGAGPSSGKTSAPLPQTDKISAPPSPTGKLSAPPPPAGKASAPPTPADKVPAPPPPAGKVSAPPAPAGKVSAHPALAGKVSAPPAPAGKVSAPAPPAGKVSAPPTPAGKVSAPPPPADKVSAPPPPPGKISAPPPPLGKTSAAPPPPGKTSAAPPAPEKMSESPSITGMVSAPPVPAGKVSAPPAPVGKVSASPPLAGKVSAPPPPPGKTSAPPPTPPAGKEKMASGGEGGGADGRGEIAKKVSSSKEPSLELNAAAEDEAAKASDVSAQKLGMPIAKKLPLAAKGPPVKAPASKMAEDAHVTVGSDEASSGSKLAGAEDSASKAEPSLPQTAPVQSSQVGTGGPTLAENGELQQHKIGAKPPGKPPQVKKALGFPPKKTMPPSVPKKMSAPPPT